MAYTIPVVALILDHQAAATAIGEPPDFFDNENNDRWAGAEALEQLTGASISIFSSEDESIFYVGVRIEEEFYIPIDMALATKANAIRQANPHPLIQSATVAVVSQFN